MATPTTSDDTENVGNGEEGVSLNVVPVGPLRAVNATPTMAEAFTMLCQALSAQLEDDLPAQLHCEEIQGWHANGNEGVAWAHAVQLLERVVGVKMGT